MQNKTNIQLHHHEVMKVLNTFKNYIDDYKNKSFKTGSYFPDNKRYISNGFHSETIINEIVEKFGLPYETEVNYFPKSVLKLGDIVKQFVHDHLLRK